MKQNIVLLLLSGLIIIHWCGCAPHSHQKLVKREIDFTNGEKDYLKHHLKNKNIVVQLQFEKPTAGKFVDITPDHLVVESVTENRYIQLSQIKSISLLKNKSSLEWLILTLGGTGAVTAIMATQQKDGGQFNLNTVLSNNSNFLRNAGIGGLIGVITGYIINTVTSKRQAIEFVSSSSYMDLKEVSVPKFIAQLERRCAPMSVQQKQQLQKLLSISAMVILDNKIGETIDLEENRWNGFFPDALDFQQAYLFQIKKAYKNQQVYFAVIITDMDEIKLKMLKNEEVLSMKAKVLNYLHAH